MRAGFPLEWDVTSGFQHEIVTRPGAGKSDDLKKGTRRNRREFVGDLAVGQIGTNGTLGNMDHAVHWFNFDPYPFGPTDKLKSIT